MRVYYRQENCINLICPCGLHIALRYVMFIYIYLIFEDSMTKTSETSVLNRLTVSRPNQSNENRLFVVFKNLQFPFRLNKISSYCKINL
ncbi:MAG TPA: hypothetical protein DC049_17760 [Spirochaetia bacterium]|nr:hypothetical protein [Spirochaetia bacterium]